MTDLDTMQDMLSRAGQEYWVTEVDTMNTANPRPGGTDLTIKASASGATLVIGFNIDGELDDIELWD